MGFLLEDFTGKTMTEKQQAVVETLGFKSNNAMRSYMNRWLPCGINKYLLIRILGINITYYIFKLIKKYRKYV